MSTNDLRPVPGLGSGFYEAGPLPFGNTCPLLKIARHYDVPYEIPLYLADFSQHGREIPENAAELFAVTPLKTIEAVTQDVRYVSGFMEELRARLAEL